MKKLMFAIAAGIFAVSASAASALPAPKTDALGSSIVDQVRDRDGVNVRIVDRRGDRRGYNRWNRGDRWNRGGRWNDRRYNQYRGWNRYNSRPRGWRNRGCVSVGPVWFCK